MSNKSNKNKEKADIKAENKNEEVLNTAEEKNTDKNTETEESKVEEKEAVEEEVSFEQKYKEMHEKYLRLTAEYDNYRKRSLKEKMDLIKSAGEDILLSILPVMDNFERALSSIEKKTNEEENAVLDGVELIYKNFKDFLAQKGVKEIEAKGKDFDTDLHEAITKIPAPEESLKGKVVDVTEKGYLMHEKVIRFAKVVVGE